MKDQMTRARDVGLRLRAMRIAMGWDDATEFCKAVTAQLGGQFTPQSLWDCEDGRILPRLGDPHCAVLVRMGFSLPYLVTGDVKHLPGDLAVAVLSELKALEEQVAMDEAA